MGIRGVGPNSGSSKNIVPESNPSSYSGGSAHNSHVETKKNHYVRRRIVNILVVDDVALNRKIVCRLMRGEGYVCFEAVDGQECVDYMKRSEEGTQDPVDLILMDYEMPRMNGPTATEVLISLGIRVPVIGITGNALKEDFDFFMDHGALAVLAKPLVISGLNIWIDELNSEYENRVKHMSLQEVHNSPMPIPRTIGSDHVHEEIVSGNERGFERDIGHDIEIGGDRGDAVENEGGGGNEGGGDNGGGGGGEGNNEGFHKNDGFLS